MCGGISSIIPGSQRDACGAADAILIVATKTNTRNTDETIFCDDDMSVKKDNLMSIFNEYIMEYDNFILKYSINKFGAQWKESYVNIR